ncbi:MAG: hypothetical protein JWO15_2353 [Sphingomonadales bacterium]|nr:hypothetical protein [Sphingomonadales bacterium]
MARKMIMIAAVAATLVTAVAPVTAMAQDRYRGDAQGYSWQDEYGDRYRSRYDGYSDRRAAWIAHDRHERREHEQARRRYWQHERWERQNEGRRDWNQDRWEPRDRLSENDRD